MSSSSESDDCPQLYMRTAQHFELKKKDLKAKRLELEEQFLNSVPEDDCETTIEAKDLTNEAQISSIDENASTNKTNICLLSDIDDNSSAVVSGTSRVLRSNKSGKRSRQSKTSTTSNKGRKRCRESVTNNLQRNTRSRRRNGNVPNNTVLDDRGIVVLDDDQDFASLHCKPIDFEQPYINKCLGDISQTINLSENIDDDELLENEDVTLSIEWNNGKGISHRVLTLGRYQKFERVYKELAKLEGLPTDRVLLLRDFTSVSPEDTPSSLNLSLYAGMKAFVTQTSVERNVPQSNSSSEGKNLTHNNEKETRIVRLQLESNKTLSLTINKDQKMVVLYKKCAEEIKCEENKLKITFDGDFVNPRDRMSDLDLEDGDLLHVHIKS